MIKSVRLRNGKLYTPRKNRPPVYPCEKCKNRKLYGHPCNRGVDICDDYLNYEIKKCAYQKAVFN